MQDVLFVLLLLLLAGMAGWLAERHAPRFDWTTGGQHTLREASREVLARLEAAVEATLFAQQDVDLAVPALVHVVSLAGGISQMRIFASVASAVRMLRLGSARRTPQPARAAPRPPSSVIHSMNDLTLLVLITPTFWRT